MHNITQMRWRDRPEIIRFLFKFTAQSDGLECVPKSFRGDLIKEGDENGAVRIVLTGLLGVALSLQIDVVFSDAATPVPEDVILRLSLKSQSLEAVRSPDCAKETVVDEWLEPIVRQVL